MIDEKKKKRLNVGCYTKKLDGWLNVDITQDVAPDQVIPKLPARMPFKDQEFDEVLFDNCMQYIEHKNVLSSLKELNRIGKKVKVSFLPASKQGGSIWSSPAMNQTGYTIGSLRKLQKVEPPYRTWYDRDFGFNVKKVWIELHFSRFSPLRIIQEIINLNQFWQQVYEDSFLSSLFHPKWYWVEFKND